VILLTAYGSPEIEAAAIRYGVDSFLQKPKPLAELAQVVFRVAGNA
jgi:CheY-like chemotaxis protein